MNVKELIEYPVVTASDGITVAYWYPDDKVHTSYYPDDRRPEDAVLAVVVWPEDPEDYEPPTVRDEVI